jgi:hypothetical protein
MAGLVPAIYVFGIKRTEDVGARRLASEATPFLERLRPGMTLNAV